MNAKLLRAVLQDVEQLLAADAGKAVAAGAHRLAAIVHGDVVPIDEVLADLRGAGGVVLFEIGQRVVGEHDTPAEGVMRLVALDHPHVRGGIAPFQRDREIKAAGTAAETDRAHEPSS
jgi:hypothetical protein